MANSAHSLSVNVIAGSNEITEQDKDRAANAAVAVLDAAKTTISDAFAEYARQWEEFDDEAPMTGLARIWADAQAAANRALTEGWHNPAAASCGISA